MPTPILVTLSKAFLVVTRGPAELYRRKVLSPDDLTVVTDATAKYAAAGRAERPLGYELYKWLDGPEGWLTAVLKENPSEVWLELTCDSQGAVAFLEAPWELLADEVHFLADKKGLSFSVVRRYAPAVTPDAPGEYRPSVVFMASDPVTNHTRLDYEAEETAILRAIGVNNVDFLCEDSGNLAILSQRVKDETERDVRVDIVHLSCHGRLGEIPVLQMETELGDPEEIGVRELERAFIDPKKRPRLLFVSACETAEADKLLGSLAGALAKNGFPAVLGWAGKIQDRAATRFAAELYKNLADQLPLEQAVAEARRSLKNAHDEEQFVKGEWHKARLFFGAAGGGPISAGQRRRHWHDADRADSEFLDKVAKRVKVASRWQFVGRRRPIQAVLRTLRGNRAKGVRQKPTVIHGLGQHGKSSLAARIASRFPALETVVVFDDYTPRGILQAIRATITNSQALNDIIARHIAQVNDSPDEFRLALGELLSGPLRELQTTNANAIQRPILLIIDDFEQALEPVPGQVHRVRERNDLGVPLAPGLAEVFREFARTEGQSRLLITSRFKFTCVSGGQDAAEKLAFFQLPDMLAGDLQRQARNLAAERVAEMQKNDGIEQKTDELKTKERALFLALDGMTELVFGSPRLMSRAASLLAEGPAEFAAFRAAAQEYKSKGTVTNQALVDVLEHIAVDALLDLLHPDERELLRRSCLFQIPVPSAVAELLHPRHAADARLAAAQALRLFALGLWNRFEDPLNHRKAPNHALVDPLVRPKVDVEAPT